MSNPRQLKQWPHPKPILELKEPLNEFLTGGCALRSETEWRYLAYTLWVPLKIQSSKQDKAGTKNVDTAYG